MPNPLTLPAAHGAAPPAGPGMRLAWAPFPGRSGHGRCCWPLNVGGVGSAPWVTPWLGTAFTPGVWAWRGLARPAGSGCWTGSKQGPRWASCPAQHRSGALGTDPATASAPDLGWESWLPPGCRAVAQLAPIALHWPASAPVSQRAWQRGHRYPAHVTGWGNRGTWTGEVPRSRNQCWRQGRNPGVPGRPSQTRAPAPGLRGVSGSHAAPLGQHDARRGCLPICGAVLPPVWAGQPRPLLPPGLGRALVPSPWLWRWGAEARRPAAPQLCPPCPMQSLPQPS